MTRSDMPTADPVPLPAPLRLSDLGTALALGWRDFRRAPAFGLLFSGFYVAGGWVIAAVALSVGRDWWLIPFILGFPLIAPFAAVGLYEVSRRIERAEPLDWPQVIRVVIAQKDRQVPSMAMVILLMFMFWVFVAHTIFAVFLGTASLTHVTSSAQILMEGRGLAMLAVGTLVGAGFAAALFAFTVVGLPLLLDREVDFITAIIASVRAVLQNPVVLGLWGALIAGLLFLAILPGFLGLFLVLPVLGHASWHLYRQLLPDGPDGLA
ncbi:MAG: DUF2189 domain-containing protein [Paracoccus sp.]|nr:DUF2189 domain-containing protein [Paracoccus sp. (in: a-proteobacteria)]